MVWMQPVHFSFVDGLDATSPFFFSQWSGCNQSIFLFLSMVWMQPVHFSFLDGLDATSPYFFSPWSGCNQSIFLLLMVWMQPVHVNLVVWCRVKPSKARRNASRMREWKAEYVNRTKSAAAPPEDTCLLHHLRISSFAHHSSLWLGVPSYFYFDVAWSSELFVFRCGSEF